MAVFAAAGGGSPTSVSRLRTQQRNASARRTVSNLDQDPESGDAPASSGGGGAAAASGGVQLSPGFGGCSGSMRGVFSSDAGGGGTGETEIKSHVNPLAARR